MEKVGTIKVKNVKHDVIDIREADYPTSFQLLKKIHNLAEKRCIIKSVYKRIEQGDYGLTLICPQGKG